MYITSEYMAKHVFMWLILNLGEKNDEKNNYKNLSYIIWLLGLLCP